MALPDFFIFGAPKAGTTALHAALAEHPQLFMSPVKEPKFYLCDGPPPDHGGPGDAHSYREWIWRPEEYERLFDAAPPGTLRGESTPFYLSDLAAHRRVHRAVPDARLVVVLRDPVDRAYSNWAHLWADGLETIGDFVAACAEEPAPGPGRVGAVLALPGDRSLRAAAPASLFGLFPRHQVLVLRYLVPGRRPGRHPRHGLPLPRRRRGPGHRDPGPERGRLCAPHAVHPRCCGRPSGGGAELGRHFPPQVWRKASLPLQWLIQRTPQHRPELAEGDRAQLVSYFDEDITIVEEETGWDLDAWRTYREGGTYSVRKSWAPSRRLVS